MIPCWQRRTVSFRLVSMRMVEERLGCGTVVQLPFWLRGSLSLLCDASLGIVLFIIVYLSSPFALT